MTTRVLGVNGSLRPGSSADRALRFLLGLLQEEGAACESFDIGQLPLLDGRPDDGYPEAVRAWRAACSDADALVISTPSYHGAIPGGLKNALDFIDRPHVGGKPVAIVAIAGGDAEPAATDAARVLRHIRAIAALPDIVVSRAAERWGKGPEPDDPALAQEMRRVAEDLVRLCNAEDYLPLPEAS